MCLEIEGLFIKRTHFPTDFCAKPKLDFLFLRLIFKHNKLVHITADITNKKKPYFKVEDVTNTFPKPVFLYTTQHNVTEQNISKPEQTRT